MVDLAASAGLRHIWTEVDGLPVHALASAASASSGRRIVVLVHGLGLSGRYMVPTAAKLAERYAVLVPDLPGFGDSGKPGRILDVPGLADALAAWMRAAVAAPAALLGNSFGCQIIVDLAARHPDVVERAILQGPTAPPEERTWLMQLIRWRQNQPYNPPDMGPVTWGDYRKCGILRLLRTFQYSLRDPVEAKLPGIGAPVLVVRGTRDPICRQDWAERVVRALPRGRLTLIPDVAHTLCWTAPVELTRAVRAFLDETGC